jgi:streptogramin lyase
MKPTLLLLLGALSVVAADQKIVRPGVPGVQTGLTTLKPATTFQLGGSPDWMAITDDAVWISNSRLKVVQRIDPKRNQVTGNIEFQGHPCSGLVTGFGSLWVPVCGKPGSLSRVDLATGTISKTIAVEPADSEGSITASPNGIWIVTDKNGTLVEIDPHTNAIKNKVALPAGSLNPLYADGLVWISGNSTNQLIAVDPAKSEVVARIPVGPGPRFMTAGAGSVWTLNQGDGSVTRVDTKQRTVVASIAAGIPGPGGEICIGDGSVWTTVFDIPLTRIDVKTNKVTRQWTGTGGDSVRAAHGSIWLTDLRRGLLWRIPYSQF